jgi:hypothetical protein
MKDSICQTIKNRIANVRFFLAKTSDVKQFSLVVQLVHEVCKNIDNWKGFLSVG